MDPTDPDPDVDSQLCLYVPVLYITDFEILFYHVDRIKKAPCVVLDSSLLFFISFLGNLATK
jgi:hypothetical protein